MKNNRCGPLKGRGDTLRMFLSRGDPPIIIIIGGGPPRGSTCSNVLSTLKDLFFRAICKWLKNSKMRFRFSRNRSGMFHCIGDEFVRISL